MNKNYVGLDISTKTIGVCAVDENQQLIMLKHCNPIAPLFETNEEYILYEKKKCFINFFNEEIIPLLGNVDRIFIETPLYSSNNQFTIIKLAKFNSLISCSLYELGFNVTHITEHESRKFFFPEYVKIKKVKNEIKETLSFPKDCDKKQLVWNKVNSLEKNVKWLYNSKGVLKKENYDMTDAYVVCKAGINIISNV